MDDFVGIGNLDVLVGTGNLDVFVRIWMFLLELGISYHLSSIVQWCRRLIPTCFVNYMTLR